MERGTILELKPGMTCEFRDCVQPATHIACGRGDESDRHPGISVYCELHAHIVADEGYPEYIESCPNCGCMFGVN